MKQHGLDLQLEYQATSALSLRATGAYTHNRFADFVGQCYGYSFPAGTTRAQQGGAAPGVAPVAPSGCQFASATSTALVQNFQDRAPARSPTWAGDAGFTVNQPLGRYSLNVSGDAIYSSGYYPGETMAPGTYQKSYGKLNANITLVSPAGWELSFIGRNLTNKYVVVYATDRTGGQAVPLSPSENRGVVARGRELTLQASYKF